MKMKTLYVILFTSLLFNGFVYAQADETVITETPAVDAPVVETPAEEEVPAATEQTPVAEEVPAVTEQTPVEKAVVIEEEKDRRPAIAVVDFKALGVSSTEAAFVSDFLRSALVSSKAFRVIDRANMEKVLAEQGFQQTGCTTQECAVQMGRMLNVKNMISGNFGRLGNIFQITVSAVKVETGEIVYSDSTSCSEPSELQSKTKELALRMAKSIGIQPEEKPELVKQEPVKLEPVKIKSVLKQSERKPATKLNKIPIELPDEEFEPPVKMERLRRSPLFAGDKQEVRGIAPYYSFQFSEGAAFPSMPSLSSGSTRGDWFFASSLVNDVGLIIKPSKRHSLLIFYELKYNGPGLERQEGREFSEKTMDHIIFGQLQIGITDRLRIKLVGNYMTEFQRTGTNETWTSGKYNFERVGGDIRVELDDLLFGARGSIGAQVNYLNFPNYSDLLEEFQMGDISETIGGKQNQTTIAGVISLKGRNFKIGWKTELQAFERQYVVGNDGTYSDTLLQADSNSALNVSAKFGKRFSIMPSLIVKWKDSNQHYLHFKYVGATPEFKGNYYDYSQGSVSAVIRWRVTERFDLFFVPRGDLRNYSWRQPRDVNNEFIANTLQQNTTLVLSVGFTRYSSEVSSYSIFYTYVKQGSNMKFETYQPYNYTGQYVGIRFNFTF